MRELTSAVTLRLKGQGQRKSAIQLWARIAAAFEKDDTEGVADMLGKLVERPEADGQQ
jgi:hypothetical protein